MDADRAVDIFVFPLPRMVFYPGTTKPLNIFEPRYIQMINEAIEGNVPVALAFSEPQRLSEGAGALGVRRIAGVGRPIVLEARADGTLLVLVESLGKVRLGRRRASGGKPYIVCSADWVRETNRLEPENIFMLNRLNKEFIRWLEANVGDREQLSIFLSQLKSPFEKVNYLCSLMIHDPETQQSLLEADDINDRLRVVSLLFDQDREHARF